MSEYEIAWTKGYNDCHFELLKTIEDIKAEFTSLYPKNVYGGLELGGRSCVFSLNKVFEIIDKYIDDECTANDCEECKNNYDCISYLEECERMNSEDEDSN